MSNEQDTKPVTLPPIKGAHNEPDDAAESISKGQLRNEVAIPRSSSPAFMPRDHDEWHSTTEATLCRVDKLTRDIHEKVHQNQAAEAAARAAVQEQKDKERKKQRLKVHARMKEHEAVIKDTYKCMKEIQHAMVQVEGAQGRLVAERYTRFAETKVCEYRLDLREKRPAAEKFTDTIHHALEKELETLNHARQELLHQEREAKEIVGELRLINDCLGKDIGNRRLAMTKDLSTIGPGQDVPLCSPECISNKRSLEMQQKAYKLSEAGLHLSDHSEVLVTRIRRHAANVAKRVTQAFLSHTKELAVMRAKLARQVVDSEAAIDKAELQLSHMKQRVDMGDMSLSDRADALKATLRDLRAIRQKTSEDLRNKTIALELDNSCRKVTAQMASGEAPPNKLSTSSSAPALGSKKMASTTGRLNSTMTSGNPQQGDAESSPMRHSGINFASAAGSPGGSGSLKAAGNQFVQGQ